jgi:preprotein translocase subunit SecG
MLTLTWTFLGVILVILILIKIPEKQGGIQSISGLNNVLGSPKNTDNTIDTIIWTLIFSFLGFGSFLNIIN